MSTRPFAKSRLSIYISIPRFLCLIESVKLCTFVRQASFQAQPSSPSLSYQSSSNRKPSLSPISPLSVPVLLSLCRTCRFSFSPTQHLQVNLQGPQGPGPGSPRHKVAFAHSGCSLLEMIQHPEVRQIVPNPQTNSPENASSAASMKV